MDQIDYNSMHNGGQIQLPIEDKRVGFGKRLAAYVIDALASTILAVFLMFAIRAMNVTLSIFDKEKFEKMREIYSMIGLGDFFTEELVDMLAILTVATVVAALAYTLIEGLTGASPGKRVLRIYIAHADGSAGNTTLWLKRWAMKNSNSIAGFFALMPSLSFLSTIGSLIGFVIVIGCFFALQRSRQALHDRMAGTAVFNVDSDL
ncbi:MAG: RDD family protein [Ignavibacteria bacterium]|nr:RDD family protein [Ignavibacteria bacterium]